VVNTNQVSDLGAAPADKTNQLLIETSRLSVSVDGYIGEIRMIRPEALNATDARLHRDFPDALRALREVDGLRAVVFCSSGKVFSAGGDFDYLVDLHEKLPYLIDTLEEGCRTFLELSDFPVPIVAAVQGDAMGWGATMALGCDAVVASRNARFADPHVRVGMVAGDGGCVVWPQVMGMLWAKRYLITGDPIGAEEGYLRGMVTDLVDTPEEVDPAAFALAQRVAALPPLAVRGTKRVLNRTMQQRAGEILELGVFIQGLTVKSDDLLEAVAAFRERRPGSYHGS
jgi:enoyl-CoA hydratase